MACIAKCYKEKYMCILYKTLWLVSGFYLAGCIHLLPPQDKVKFNLRVQ